MIFNQPTSDDRFTEAYPHYPGKLGSEVEKCPIQNIEKFVVEGWEKDSRV